ncbi:MAG: GNAT family N-acetyltransferase [Sphingomonadales bacterium]|nr:GNAT family N-acetyltransferase [Sphingomonadales bacterium]
MIDTARLILRSWRDADVDPFHAICSDPLVMAMLGPVMSREQVATRIGQMQAMQQELGHCFWAVERRDDARLIGWCGVIRGDAGPVDGKAELGWRLASDCWGQGYASEAARGALAWTFDHLPDDAAWAITSVENRASRAVMDRLGMVYLPELDFDHPGVAANSPLLRHVTYRIGRPG